MSEPRKKIDKGDHEFLPAALEMLETPPSPVRMAMLIAICLLFVVGIAWSWIGRVDIVAIANGKLQPAGRVRLVQPIEAGKVRRLLVSNGQIVQKDDVLVELSPDDAKADVAAAESLLRAIAAEIAWRRSFAGLIAERKASAPPEPHWAEGAPDDIRSRERRVYRSSVSQLFTTIAALRAQKAQKSAEREKLLATVKSQQAFVQTLQERVDMRATLVEREAGSRASLIDALEKLREQQTALASQTGQIKEISAALVVLDREIERSFQTAAADNSQKLSAAERQHDEMVQRLSKARGKLSGLVIKAPEAGTVQALSIVNAGQVVSAGEHIMRIVPANAELEVEAFALNRDIGFIKEGQQAIIKVESFPFTRYGTIEGVVAKVARDAVPQPDALQGEGNPGQGVRPLGPGGTQRVQNLVFPIIIKPKNRYVTVEGKRVPVGPGMTVSAEIKTGKRRMIEFLFAPLLQTTQQALKER